MDVLYRAAAAFAHDLLLLPQDVGDDLGREFAAGHGRLGQHVLRLKAGQPQQRPDNGIPVALPLQPDRNLHPLLEADHPVQDFDHHPLVRQRKVHHGHLFFQRRRDGQLGGEDDQRPPPLVAGLRVEGRQVPETSHDQRIVQVGVIVLEHQDARPVETTGNVQDTDVIRPIVHHRRPIGPVQQAFGHRPDQELHLEFPALADPIESLQRPPLLVRVHVDERVGGREQGCQSARDVHINSLSANPTAPGQMPTGRTRAASSPVPRPPRGSGPRRRS